MRRDLASGTIDDATALQRQMVGSVECGRGRKRPRRQENADEHSLMSNALDIMHGQCHTELLRVLQSSTGINIAIAEW